MTHAEDLEVNVTVSSDSDYLTLGDIRRFIDVTYLLPDETNVTVNDDDKLDCIGAKCRSADCPDILSVL